MKTYKGFIKNLTPNQIFVFGSNTQGRHGRGAAHYALLNFGAVYGQARGPQGQSYAIVTKDLTTYKVPSRSPEQILLEIKELYKYATEHPELEFLIAYQANHNNLCGYTSKQLANIFSSLSIPENIVFEEEFSKLLN